MIGPDFKVGDKGEEIETIGGLVFAATGRIPPKGEIVEAIEGFDFEVLDADPRRIKTVQHPRPREGRRAGQAEARRRGLAPQSATRAADGADAHRLLLGLVSQRMSFGAVRAMRRRVASERRRSRR